MSSPMKLAILALISTAVAAPHYSHNKYHKPSEAYGTGKGPKPTGRWGGKNSTAIAYPTGTGSAVIPEEKTTTLDETLTSTTTIFSTIYVEPSPSPVSKTPTAKKVDLTTPKDDSCGPETVYVTATDKVTITVTASASPSSEAIPSPSSVTEDKVSVSIPNKGQEKPKPTTTEKEYPAVTQPAPAPPKETQPKDTPKETPKASVAPSKTVDTPSPAPKPPKSGKHGKRGLAYNDANLCKNFAGKATWAYSWGSTPGGDLPEGIKFVPMPWTKNEDAAKWLKHVDAAIKSGTDVVMGFNEVDHPAQAAMDPATACQKWSEYMQPIKNAHPGVTILGPSVTNAGDKPNWGLDWLKNFAKVCPGAKYDATNIHFYDVWQEGEGEIDERNTMFRFKQHIKKAHEQTGQQIWLTEFGLNPGSSPQDSQKFLKAAMEHLDGCDYVDGYSYFMVGSGENQLNAGMGLSSIGELYVSA